MGQNITLLFSKFKKLVTGIAKAYIPLQRELPRVGASHWTIPQMGEFHVAYTNMLVSKKPSGPSATLQSTQHEPVKYTYHWVIEGLIRVGHVHFMSFVPLFPRWVREN